MIDLRDMMLKATADVQGLFLAFDMRMTKPLVNSEAAQMWMQLPDELKEQFKREQPEAYGALMAALKKGE